MTSHVHAIDIMPRRNAGNVKIPSFSMAPIAMQQHKTFEINMSNKSVYVLIEYVKGYHERTNYYYRCG
jgi:hypothetical protein